MKIFSKIKYSKFICLIIYLLSIICYSSVINSKTKSELNETFICSECKNIFGRFRDSNHNFQTKFWNLIATEICIQRRKYDTDVCKQGIGELTPTVIDSIITHWSDPDLVCPFLKLCPKVYQKLNINEKIKEILKDKPAKKLIIPSKKIIKVLHMSDLHTDYLYKEGSNANCDLPLCCRESKDNLKSEFTKAGKWGSLASCDLPIRTLDQFVNFVNKKFKIDFAVWTGDNTSHDVWAQSYGKNQKNSKDITELFKAKFNFTIYAVVGNHESYPVNVYDFLSDREASFDYFFADLWKDWIGQESVNQFKQNAYYSTYNKNLNLKIIGLNSQACNPLNWYLIKDSTDPGDSLKWLREELYESEKANHSVYILSHFPPNECLQSWARIYTAIVDRFSNIIKAQFSGHTHGDSFQVTRDSHTGNINNVIYLPGSITTYTNRNPSFRVYESDLETLIPIDYSQYRLNLDKWNSLPNEIIEWDLAYEFTKEYELKDSSYESFEYLVNKLSSDEGTMKKFADNECSGRNHRYKNNTFYYCSTFPTPTQRDECMGVKPTRLNKLFEFLRGSWKEKIENLDFLKDELLYITNN